MGHGNGRYHGNLSIRVAHDLPRANCVRLAQFDLTIDANVATMKLQRVTGQVAACAGGGVRSQCGSLELVHPEPVEG